MLLIPFEKQDSTFRKLFTFMVLFLLVYEYMPPTYYIYVSCGLMLGAHMLRASSDVKNITFTQVHMYMTIYIILIHIHVYIRDCRIEVQLLDTACLSITFACISFMRTLHNVEE